MTNEEYYIIIAIWLCVLLGSYLFRKPPGIIIGSIFGLWTALKLGDIDPFITLALVALNLYTAYNGLEQWDG